MSLERSLFVLSAAAATLYGTALIARPPSRGRAAARTVAIGALATLAYAADLPSPLIAALTLSAWGCGVRVTAGTRPIPSLIAPTAFLVALLAYGSMFWDQGGGRYALLAEPWRNIGVAWGIVVGTLALMAAWRGLGAWRWPTAAYLVVQAAATGLAFTLPHRLWPAMAGAVLLALAAAIKVWERRLGARTWWLGFAAWWPFYGAQALMTWAYLR